MEPRLDKTKFRKGTVEEMDDTREYWMSRTPAERLRAAYHLTLRAYGYDPKSPPRMDKTVFSKRRHEVR